MAALKGLNGNVIFAAEKGGGFRTKYKQE